MANKYMPTASSRGAKGANGSGKVANGANGGAKPANSTSGNGAGRGANGTSTAAKSAMVAPRRIIDFIGISRFTIPISILLIIASLYLIFVKGFTLGIDFAGGASLQLRYEQKVDLPKLRKILHASEYFKKSEVSLFGSEYEVLIKMPYNKDKVKANMQDIVYETLSSSGKFEIRAFDIVGPKVGDELRQKGMTSLALALIAILLYVSYRYEWKFAVAGIIALLHDVIITSASIIFFHIDMNLEVIAALLTLIGYSINDTIIIFDRIRETLQEDGHDDFKTVVNKAITATLRRSIFTSATVFFVVLTLYVFGSNNIVGFSLPMLVGTIVGTYSSIFIAPEIIMYLGFNADNYRKALREKERKKEERARMRKMYEGGQI